MPNNGWSDEDCLRFRHTINQYNSISNNRRQLYLHRLAIEFPDKTSKDIVSALLVALTSPISHLQHLRKFHYQSVLAIHCIILFYGKANQKSPKNLDIVVF